MNTNYSNPTNNPQDYLNLSTSKSYEVSLLAHSKTEDKIKTISESLRYLDLADNSNKRAIAASIGFTGKNFEPNTPLNSKQMDELIEKEIITPITKHVITYEREDYKKLFNFQDNGFEYLACSPHLLEHIKSLDLSNITKNDLENLRSLLQNDAEDWADRQGLSYTTIMPLEMVYRSTEKGDTFSGAEKRAPVTLAHIDFNPEGQLDFLPESYNKYINATFDVTQMVNIWLPLQPEPTKNTLAMLDVQRLEKKDISSSIAEFEKDTKDLVQFKSLVINSSKRHQFVIQSDMKLGDMVIFDSMRTPHSAVDIPRPNINEELPRKSVELRFMILKEKS